MGRRENLRSMGSLESAPGIVGLIPGRWVRRGAS